MTLHCLLHGGPFACPSACCSGCPYLWNEDTGTAVYPHGEAKGI